MPRVKPFTFTLDATREDDPRHSVKLTVNVTREIIDEARRRGLTGEEMLELAIERELQLREQN